MTQTPRGTAPTTDRTSDLAAFVAGLTYEDLSAEVADFMAKCVLDFTGVAIGGAGWAESSAAFESAVAALAPTGAGTVIGTSEGRPYEYAALLNGLFAHSLEYDDTNIEGKLHPGAPIIASSLAVAEQLAAGGAAPTGHEFLTALAAGYEVTCRLGVALQEGAYDRGFHPTGICGLFGAVAAGARLRRFSAEQTDTAFGLAGSMASGSMQYLANGSWNKRLHGGLAAHNAHLALALAAAGVKGAVQALDGQYGFLTAYTDSADPDALTRGGLGRTWVMLDTGIKPYPCCRLTHGAIDCALALREQLPDGPAPHATLTLAIAPLDNGIVGGTAENKIAPGNTVEGQFSVYFHTAAALLHGRPDWSVYQHIADPDVRDLARRITIVPDDARPHAGAVLTYHPTGRAGDGDLVEKVDVPTGDPGHSVPWEVLETKFHSLAVAVFDDAGRARIAAAARALADDGAVEDLVEALRVRPTD